MACKQRYRIPVVSYHFMLKGNDGQTIFFHVFFHDAGQCRMCLLKGQVCKTAKS